MSSPPGLQNRRTSQWYRELRARAKAWIPDWQFAEATGDFGDAVLHVAARFQSEVAQRLDHVSVKSALGFVDWLGIVPRSGNAATVPVAFRLAAGAQATVTATASTRLQADADAGPVVFETTKDVDIVPATILSLVALDPDNDHVFVAPGWVTSLDAVAPPTGQWGLASRANAGSTRLQLTPLSGLGVGTVLRQGLLEYTVAAAPTGGLATITPALGTPGLAPDPTNDDAGLEAGSDLFDAVTDFTPFDQSTRDSQEHALYIGDADLLDMTSAGTISVTGGNALVDGVWDYWGKQGDADPGWLPLSVVRPVVQDLVLQKTQVASFELLELEGRKPARRWLRARLAPSAVPPTSARSLSGVALQINADESTEVDPKGVIAATNTTPLVIDEAFYPFGRIPRQFDTFYIGCDEAFSKSGATATLNLDMSEPTLGALAVANDGAAQPLVFGTGQDGALHRFQMADGSDAQPLYLGPARPPATAASGDSTLLAANVDPSLFVQGGVAQVFVATNQRVWQWSETIAQPGTGTWTDFGLPIADGSATAIDQLVLLGQGGAGTLLVAKMAGGQIRMLDLPRGSSSWKPVYWKTNDPTVAADDPWLQLVPIHDAGASGQATTVADKLLGTQPGSNPGQVELRMLQRLPEKWGRTDLGAFAEWDAEVAPVAITSGNDVRLFTVTAATTGADAKPAELHAITVPSAAQGAAAEQSKLSLGSPVVGRRLATRLINDELYVLLVVKRDASDAEPSQLAWWRPDGGDLAKLLFTADVSAGAAALREVPAFLDDGNRLVASSTQPGLLLNSTSLFRSRAFNVDAADLETGFVLKIQLSENDVVALSSGEAARIETVTGLASGDWLYTANFSGSDAQGSVFPDPSKLKPVKVKLKGDGPNPVLSLSTSARIVEQSRLLIAFTDQGQQQLRAFDVAKVTTTWAGPTKVQLKQPFRPGDGPVYCWIYDAEGAPAESSTRQVDLFFQAVVKYSAGPGATSITAGAMLYFPNGKVKPARQQIDDVDARNQRLVLHAPWEKRPQGGSLTAVVQPATDPWSELTGDVSSNPLLSWEYWNDRGWWSLAGVVDETANLKRSGAISFTIPSDLKPTQVQSQKGRWIRARLVGGDYGRESYTITSTPAAGGSQSAATRQEVTVDTNDVRPPIVVRLGVAYRIDQPTPPALVLASDSGSWSDQSDCNRAKLPFDVFVPVSTRLAPFGPAAAPPVGGHALYIGFSQPPLGASVKLFFKIATEQDNTALAPLKAEVLRDRAFELVPTEDETLALGESGMVTMSIDGPLALTELFGSAAYWIRLTPTRNASTWSPSIAGAFVNCTWASAIESQELEILGTSDGSPDQMVVLSRKPVLPGSVVLLVREFIGDDERLQLPPGTLIVSLPGLPGDWVRWAEVDDPADYGPNDRVYALDPVAGEIHFGDGVRGFIPPVGTDSIVAQTYKRMSGASADLVAERATLDLVSPIAGVDSVVTVDRAEGGSDPETAVMLSPQGASVTEITGSPAPGLQDLSRYFSDDPAQAIVLADSASVLLQLVPAQLRQRGRAVTLRDLQDMARYASVDVAQALAMDAPNGVRVLVVARGDSPKPSQALCRAVTAYLVERASPAWAHAEAIDVSAPTLVPFTVKVKLSLPTLDESGGIAQDAKQAITALFDPASGGFGHHGWPIGAVPREEDVGACLVVRAGGAMPYEFESASIATADGAALATLASDALAVLEPGGVSVEVDLKETP